MDVVNMPNKAPARHNVPLFMRLGDVPMGRSRNLSINGVFVETGERPPIGSHHDLCLVWDAVVHTCTARIVRHADDGIGLTFEDVDTFFLQAIAEIIADSAPPPPPLYAAL